MPVESWVKFRHPLKQICSKTAWQHSPKQLKKGKDEMQSKSPSAPRSQTALGRAVWYLLFLFQLFLAHTLLKQVSIYFSFVGKCCNSVLHIGLQNLTSHGNSPCWGRELLFLWRGLDSVMMNQIATIHAAWREDNSVLCRLPNVSEGLGLTYLRQLLIIPSPNNDPLNFMSIMPLPGQWGFDWTANVIPSTIMLTPRARRATPHVTTWHVLTTPTPKANLPSSHFLTWSLSYNDFWKLTLYNCHTIRRRLSRK